MIGRGVTPSASVLTVLSSSCQVAPPSSERRKPTPGRPWPVPVPLGSPVPAMMIDWLGLLFRGKMAIEPMLTALVGPKSVSGIQVGPSGLVVRKSVVFQMPPLAAPM